MSKSDNCPTLNQPASDQHKCSITTPYRLMNVNNSEVSTGENSWKQTLAQQVGSPASKSSYERLPAPGIRG